MGMVMEWLALSHPFLAGDVSVKMNMFYAGF